jgi:CubicO group peptidase (beta-lactamase class C family)
MRRTPKKKKLRHILIFLLFFSLSFYSYISLSASSTKKEYYEELSPVKIVLNETLFDSSELEPYHELNFPLKTEQLKDKITNRAKVTKFHGSILIAYKDKIVLNEQIGYQDPLEKIHPNENISYELASVSKQFTAASILLLQEEECLRIDEPVSNYLPGFKFENVTIRHLLKHSSGVWDYMYITEAFWKKKHAPSNKEVVALINKHQRNLNFRVGSRFSYNNSNYVLLAAIVEKVAEQHFQDFLQERFFNSLCLDNSYVGLESRYNPDVADAFIGYGRGYVSLPPSFHNAALGDKGVYSSSTDLWRWFKSLKNNEILSEESVQLMFNQDEFNTYKYGMGFRTKRGKNKEPIIYHNGIWDGYRNGLTYLPQDDIVIIILSNTQNKNKKYLQDYLINESKKFVDIL